MRRVLPSLLILCAASLGGAAELTLTVVDEDGASNWARFEVRGPDGRMYQPDDALRDRTARNRAAGEPWYIGSFVGKGPQKLEVPAGEYRVVVQRGPEHRRFDEKIRVGAAAVEKEIRLERWIDMNELGFYSGDFQIHRPMHEAEPLMLADDLNFGVVVTVAGTRDDWKNRAWPKNPLERIDEEHLYTVVNAESQRGGGAWLLHMLRDRVQVNFPGPWSPSSVDLIAETQGQRYVPTGFPWVDAEMPFNRELPVAMALETPDSIGLLHEHFLEYGVLDHEAGGRPRDLKRFPGREGFADASLEILYRFWNLGFEVPASASSASGAMPNPVGYNRIYVEVPERFDVEPFYRNLRQGRSFVTNGPMLFFNVQALPNHRIGVSLDVRSREPLTKVELIANGVVVESFAAPPGKTRFETEVSLREGLYTWVAARAYSESESTIRMAHTQPVWMFGHWPARDDAQFFVEWIDELIADSTADSARFASEGERDQVLAIYEQARAFYLGLQ